MKDDTVVALRQPESFSDDPLTEILRAGARQLLGQAIEAEVAAHIEAHADLTDASGRRRIVRHGHMPEREVQTGIGAATVKRPRVRDRDPQATGGRIRFTSSILPPYLRRAKSVEALLPWLYLKGISSGDFSEALAALLGPDAPGLTASTIGRLKAVWWDEYEAWQKRDLSARRYVYFWADGVYFSPRMDHDKQCVLVIIGADAMGNKDIVGMVDGYRESAQSWKELLLDLKRRGLETGCSSHLFHPSQKPWNFVSPPDTLSGMHKIIEIFADRAALHTEILALRQQVAVLKRQRPRPSLRKADRVFWVILSCLWPGWRHALVIVRPETVIGWHRKAFRLFWTWKSRRGKPGRPPVSREIRYLVRRMSRENTRWGAPRIHGELLKLGFSISQAAVSKYMVRYPSPPSQSWRTFLTNHADCLASINFFVVPTATFHLLFGFIVLHHERRQIVHFGVTANPTMAWVAQQIREAFRGARRRGT